MSFMLGFRPDYGIPRVCGLVGLGEGLSSSAPRASSMGGPGPRRGGRAQSAQRPSTFLLPRPPADCPAVRICQGALELVAPRGRCGAAQGLLALTAPSPEGPSRGLVPARCALEMHWEPGLTEGPVLALQQPRPTAQPMADSEAAGSCPLRDGPAARLHGTGSSLLLGVSVA